MLDGRVAPARHSSISRSRTLPRETRRAERAADARLHAAGLLDVPLERRSASALAPRSRGCCAAGLDAATTSEPEVGLVLGAARRRADVRRRSTWLERVWRKTENGARARRSPSRTSSRWRRSSRCARCRAGREILDEQLARIAEPGSQGAVRVRAAGAVAPIRRVRDAFFDELEAAGEPPARAVGPRGLDYLHHPLRAASSRKVHSGRASRCCARFSAPGDIFFPQRWMDATLGGHSSASAAQMVDALSRGAAGRYPDRLRRVILSRRTICSARAASRGDRPA